MFLIYLNPRGSWESEREFGRRVMEKTAPGWRSPGSPLFVEESYLGSINVLDPRQALHLPCTVTGLTVEGNKRTRREMIQREMRAAVEARTHAELAAGVSPRSAYSRSVPGCRCSVACAQYLSTPRRRRLPSPPPLRRLLWPRLRKCPRQSDAISHPTLNSAGGFHRSVQSC